MRTVRTVLTFTLVGALLGVPASGFAATTLPKRVATLKKDFPGLFYPSDKGRGNVVLRLDGPERRICYRLEFENFVVRALTIYRKGADEVSDYEIKLYDEAPTEESPLRGCVSDADVVTRAQIREIKRHPTRFFVMASEYDGDEIGGTIRRP